MKGASDQAIQDYNSAIELEPDLGEIYISRADAWLHLKEWEKARADLNLAKDKGVDILLNFIRYTTALRTLKRKMMFSYLKTSLPYCGDDKSKPDNSSKSYYGILLKRRCRKGQLTQ